MTRFFDKRFVIISGKGGTGKSTVCAAIALAAARMGRRVLVAELNVREKVPQLFGAPPSGYEPRRIFSDGPGWVESANIIPEECLREYGVMKLKLRRLYRLVFENDVMRRIVRMLPGMNELLILGKAMFLESETIDHGRRPRWDMLVVDAPATGHGVSMFRLPQVILEVIPSGPLAEDARRIIDLLRDERRTSFNIVTLPEEMAVVEAGELRERLRTVLGFPPGYLFMNAVWPETLSEHEQGLVRTFHDATRGADPVLDGVIRTVCESDARHGHQEPHLVRARQLVDLPRIDIPYVFAEQFGPSAIELVSQHVRGAIEHHEAH
jgi:anion-transporting  ArsA/GET3 family ATPase